MKTTIQQPKPLFTFTGAEFKALTRSARKASFTPLIIWWMCGYQERDIMLTNGMLNLLDDLLPLKIDVDTERKTAFVVMPPNTTREQVMMLLGIPLSPASLRIERVESQAWTKEWKPFTPAYYEKVMVDIRLKNGEEVHMCWPNAGYMNPCSQEDNPKGYKEIPYTDVSEVRLTHSKHWHS